MHDSDQEKPTPEAGPRPKAQRPPRDPEADRLLTMMVLGRPEPAADRPQATAERRPWANADRVDW